MMEPTRFGDLPLLRTKIRTSNKVTLPYNLRGRAPLPEPLWIGVRAVKLVARLVEFKLACLRGLRGFCQKSVNLGRVHWLKTADRLESLLQDRHRVATRYDHTGRKIHRVMQTLDGGDGLALKYEMIAHRLHAENSNAVLGQNK